MEKVLAYSICNQNWDWSVVTGLIASRKLGCRLNGHDKQWTMDMDSFLPSTTEPNLVAGRGAS